MIERKFISQNMQEYEVKTYLSKKLPRSGLSKIELEKTPLGMRVIIFTSKPGLIVGRKGVNLHSIVKDLKDKFKLENPQVDIKEVEDYTLDAQIMAEYIAEQINRFGPGKFKAVAFRALSQMMDSGARGGEIKISGKAPGKRATTWRFKKGYLPKCGNVAIEEIRRGFQTANPKPGVIGISVSILTKDVRMPDDVIFYEQETLSEEVEEAENMLKETKKPDKKEDKNTNEENKESEEDVEDYPGGVKPDVVEDEENDKNESDDKNDGEEELK